MPRSDLSVVPLTDSAADDLLLEAFGREPVLVQLPTVFAIFAPATVAGARSLDRCKQRLPGKYYGVIVGDGRTFFELAPDEPLSRHLLEPSDESRIDAVRRDLHGSFLRIRIAGDDVHTPVICAGQLQGLLLSGPLAETMRLMERLTEPMPDKLFGPAHRNYHAPIGSSCNMSGDPAGSISDLDRAVAFARDRGVRLCLTHPGTSGEGSQPIFGLSGTHIDTHRDGPGADHLRAVLNRWVSQAHRPSV